MALSKSQSFQPARIHSSKVIEETCRIVKSEKVVASALRTIISLLVAHVIVYFKYEEKKPSSRLICSYTDVDFVFLPLKFSRFFILKGLHLLGVFSQIHLKHSERTLKFSECLVTMDNACMRYTHTHLTHDSFHSHQSDSISTLVTIFKQTPHSPRLCCVRRIPSLDSCSSALGSLT